MKNKPDKEITSFLRLFSPKRAEPDPKFEKRLKKIVVNEFHKKNSFLNFRLSFLTIFAAVILIGLIGMTYLPDLGVRNTTTTSLNSAKKREILDNVLKNNEGVLLKQMEQSVAQTFKPEDVALQAFGTQIFEENKSDQFIQNSILTVHGPKYLQCTETKNTIERTDYYYYKDSTDTTYVKTISLNGSGQVVNYILSKKTALETEVIIFRGEGSAARIVKRGNEEEPLSYPVSYPISYPLAGEFNFFTEDIEISERVLNGYKNYVLEIKEEIECGRGMLNSKVVLVVDSETFEVERVERYLGEISPNNLIYSVEKKSVEVNDENIDFNSTFTFEYDAEIVDMSLEQLESFFKIFGDVKGVETKYLSYPTDEEVYSD